MKKRKNLIIAVVICIVISIVTILILNITKKNNSEYQEQITAIDMQSKLVEDESEKQTIAITRDEFLQTLTTEEIIKLLEERVPDSIMSGICVKLQNYAHNLGETAQYGIITLSEEEMVSIRNFLKSEEPDDGGTLLRGGGGVFTWNSDNILGYEHDKGINIMGLGIWDYQGYKFVLHCNRILMYLDKNTRKIIAITNSVDYPDDGYLQFENLLWGDDPNERIGKLCNLQATNECCYAYCKRENGIQIEKWVFGEKIHTWYGEQLDESNIWFESPTYITKFENTHFLIAKGNLLSFCEGEEEIKVIAEGLLSLEDVVTVYWAKNTIYYALSNEVHMVCLATLEDVLLAEDFESELQVTGSIGSYAIYHDKDRKAHIVAGYFDENNNVVKGEKETVKQAREYEEKVMEALNNPPY